jgi:DNA-binding GntR family transcriptional regulator
MRKQPSFGNGRFAVFEELRERICDGRLPPGSKLLQRHLADEFGVAVGVVREALLELKGCGLITVVPNLGAVVANLTARTICEALQVREMLEGLAARLCCERASRSDLRELRALADDLWRRASHEEPLVNLVAIDQKFHTRIIQISGNELIERFTHSYRALSPLGQRNRVTIEEHRLFHEQHLAIVQAIEDNLPDEAERAARAHVSTVRRLAEEAFSRGTWQLPWDAAAPADEKTLSTPR